MFRPTSPLVSNRPYHPRSNRGHNGNQNLQALCPTCHKLKTQSDMVEIREKNEKKLSLQLKKKLPGRESTPFSGINANKKRNCNTNIELVEAPWNRLNEKTEIVGGR